MQHRPGSKSASIAANSQVPFLNKKENTTSIMHYTVAGYIFVVAHGAFLDNLERHGMFWAVTQIHKKGMFQLQQRIA